MAYTESTVLSIVKARLNRLAADTSLDTYLKQRIAAADAELARNGINLIDGDSDDGVFLADFVVWRYQNRDQYTGMPDWLRLARRERFFSGKGRRVAKITATPDFGTLASGDTVTLSTTTTGANIYYTTDGSTPDDTSGLYTGPIAVTSSIMLKAVAYAQGMEPSIMFEKWYEVA